MAVNKTPLGTTLRLVVQTGVDGEGKPILKNRSFSNVNPTAADQDIFDVANLLITLQSNTLDSVERIDQSAIISA